MTDDRATLAAKLTALRSAFDGAFAEPVARPDDADEKVLEIRVGNVGYAVRLSETAGVAIDQRIVAVPGPLPELLGLTSLRGRIVPVFSLSLLLGVAAPETSRWLFLEAKERLALAFDHLEGYLRARAADVLDSRASDGAHCPETLRRGSDSLGIISVASLVRTITERVAAQPRKES